MTVPPGGLDSITTYGHHASDFESACAQRLVRTFVQLTEDVDFALATGARAKTPHLFEGEKGLRAIIPFDGEFVSDLLNIYWPHRPNLTRVYARIQVATRMLA